MEEHNAMHRKLKLFTSTTHLLFEQAQIDAEIAFEKAVSSVSLNSPKNSSALFTRSATCTASTTSSSEKKGPYSGRAGGSTSSSSSGTITKQEDLRAAEIMAHAARVESAAVARSLER